MTELTVFTDGSSHAKDRTGGWAFVLTDSKEFLYQESGGAENTTNNAMELSAVLNSLHCIYANFPTVKKVRINSDSKYVVDAIYFEWPRSWEQNGWVNSEGKATANKELWKELMFMLKKFKFRGIKVDVAWVRGHAGNHYNEVCDKLAGEARKTKKRNPLYE